MVDVLNMISSVGFPIVIAVIMAYYIKDQGEKYRQDINELNAAHKEEILTVIEALNNNTVALTELKSSLIERGFEDGKHTDRNE